MSKCFSSVSARLQGLKDLQDICGLNCWCCCFKACFDITSDEHLGSFFRLRAGGNRAAFKSGGCQLGLRSHSLPLSLLWFHPAQCWNTAFCYLLKCHSQWYCEAIKFYRIILCEQEDVDRTSAPSFSHYLVFSVLQLVCTINLVQDLPLLYVISVLTSRLPNVFLLLSHLKTFLRSLNRAMSHFNSFIYLHTFPKVHLTLLQLLLIIFLIKDYFQYTFFTPSSYTCCSPYLYEIMMTGLRTDWL